MYNQLVEAFIQAILIAKFVEVCGSVAFVFLMDKFKLKGGGK